MTTGSGLFKLKKPTTTRFHLKWHTLSLFSHPSIIWDFMRFERHQVVSVTGRDFHFKLIDHSLLIKQKCSWDVWEVDIIVGRPREPSLIVGFQLSTITSHKGHQKNSLDLQQQQRRWPWKIFNSISEGQSQGQILIRYFLCKCFSDWHCLILK